MATEDSADILRRIAAAPVAEYRGEPWYNLPGDCLVWHFRSDESFAERIDDKLTVYRSLEDRSIVGCQVKGVDALVRKLGSFDVRYQENGLSLELVFYVAHLDADDLVDDTKTSKTVYDGLRQRAIGKRVMLPIDQSGQLCEA